MNSPPLSQPISYLARRFAEVGMQLNARHGQNFLIDLNLQRLIVERAQLQPEDVVLEVGTGTGALTALMSPRAAAIVTVEIDQRLYQLASEELFGLTNVTMVSGDALRNKSHFNETVRNAVDAQLAAGSGRRLKLVANLPYSVATPVIANLLSGSMLPCTMTVTIQKELADRIVAPHGTRDYSALSIWIQSQCRVELVRTLPPSVFWPRPKVTSAIVHIEVDPVLRGRIGDLPFFHEFVRSLFFHRRKFLRSVLHSAYKEHFDKSSIDTILAEAGLCGQTRAEQLDVATLVALCDRVRVALFTTPSGS